MPQNLVTGFKRIGRSGPTVDGRVIKPEWIQEAADSYDKNLYKALIWPDHNRYFNMGGVEELRAVENNEGGKDLMARLSPNDFYLSSNKYGQRLFTSMELIPNFRKTGKHYLGGLGATDNPASAATDEIRFSASADAADVFRAEFVETGPLTESEEFEDSDSFFKRLTQYFNKNIKSDEDDDMSKEALEELKTEFKKVTDALEAFKNNSDEAEDGSTDDDQNDLSKQFAELKTELNDLKKSIAQSDDDNTEDKYAQLSTQLEDLTKKFNAALNDESGGTDAGDHTGEEDDLNAYI